MHPPTISLRQHLSCNFGTRDGSGRSPLPRAGSTSKAVMTMAPGGFDSQELIGKYLPQRPKAYCLVLRYGE